ncbi:MAG: hypothetical protein ACLQVJ_12745 [Syntrophobacteraceae bacterium]
MKRLIAVIVVCMMLLCVPGFAKASSPPIGGTWIITGSATVTSSTSGLFSLKATILKNQEVNDTWVFESGTLFSFQLGTVGPFTINKQGQVVVPTSELIPAIQADIIGTLQPDFPDTIVTVTSLTFPPITVKATKNTATFSETVTGKVTAEATIFPTHLGQTITVQTQVQLQLSGVRVSSGTPTSVNEGKDAANVISKFIVNKVVTPIFSRINIK